MSSENTKSTIGFIEILAILLVVVGIVFIFVSGKGKEDQEREVRNAIRFQDVSQIADALWKVSISSTEYASLVSEYPIDMVCEQSIITTDNFSTLLVPEYFETIPQDPAGHSYKISLKGEEKRITVCSPWGEEADGQNRLISITR
jgi:hypothetical protein